MITNEVDDNSIIVPKQFIFGEDEISRMYRVGAFNGFYTYFLIWSFSALIKRKMLLLNLSKKMKLARSVLSGLIIFAFFKLFDTKIFYLHEFSTIGTFLLYNFTTLIMSTLCIIVAIYVYLRREIVDHHNDDQPVRTNFISNILNSKNIIDLHYVPKIYLAIVLYHSFFAGLGFSGYQYFGWFEIIIFLHKIFEIFRIQKSFNILQAKKNFIAIWLFLYISIFVFGILTRGFISLIDIRKNINSGTTLCNIFSAQSFIFMMFFETFIPFPKIWPDLILNLFVTFLSYAHFYLNMKNNVMTSI